MKAALEALDSGDYDSGAPDADTLVSVYTALKTAFDAGYSKGFDKGVIAQITKQNREPDEAAIATMILRGQLQDQIEQTAVFDDLLPPKENAHVEGAPWPKDEDDDTAD